ncbi:hypothetical protein N0V85_006206, partial [Neurospora sp. IMI 360204]
MRTSRIATVLLALAPTAILGNPVPILKAGVITNDHSLAGSENTNHGLCNRDDHDCPTKTVDPGDLCINAHATMICTPGGEGNANFNQNTKRSESADSINLEATAVEAAVKVEARDDSDPDNDPDVAIWNCSKTSPRQYTCTGGPDYETCIFDDGRQVSCTDSQKTATAANLANNLEARDDTDPNVWNCSYTSLRQYQCTGGPDNETCIFDDGRQVSCTSNQKTAALQTNTRDGGDPDFTCDTDVAGDYVCTGADVRCIIGKQGDATCSFNGPDGSDGDASKFKVNTDRLALVLSTVAPKPKDDSDPFDANPNYSCAQISDWTWSCGPNGVGPGSGNGKGKSLDSRGSDDEHYDPGQECNQPQGFFGGCNGKREVDEVPKILSTRKINVTWDDVTCVY